MALYSVSRGRMSLPGRLPRGPELASEREGAANVAGAGAGHTRSPTLKASGGRGRVLKKARGRQADFGRAPGRVPAAGARLPPAPAAGFGLEPLPVDLHDEGSTPACWVFL